MAGTGPGVVFGVTKKRTVEYVQGNMEGGENTYLVGEVVPHTE